ncbi:unnamed protein product [Pleuronectes platessa]|uniref:Uncharacterized protein n=1 Tax=Pleuronectes platessa TaxID=8262 RepID=A0A9N7UYG2_PLEPL|nr:unnamed protein product [Pleuronectes platessa]
MEEPSTGPSPHAAVLQGRVPAEGDGVRVVLRGVLYAASVYPERQHRLEPALVKRKMLISQTVPIGIMPRSAGGRAASWDRTMEERQRSRWSRSSIEHTEQTTSESDHISPNRGWQNCRPPSATVNKFQELKLRCAGEASQQPSDGHREGELEMSISVLCHVLNKTGPGEEGGVFNVQFVLGIDLRSHRISPLARTARKTPHRHERDAVPRVKTRTHRGAAIRQENPEPARARGTE